MTKQSVKKKSSKAAKKTDISTPRLTSNNISGQIENGMLLGSHKSEVVFLKPILAAQSIAVTRNTSIERLLTGKSTYLNRSASRISTESLVSYRRADGQQI